MTVFGTVEVTEQLLRRGRRGPEWRPFCEAAGVKHRGYSRRLQRVMVDFGAEHSFEGAAARVQEHYGIEVPAEGIRQQVLAHGRRIPAQPDAAGSRPVSRLVTQMDGSMIPVMEPGRGVDRRKGKRLYWREVRLCCARAAEQVEAVYGATLGSAQTAGWLWDTVARSAGYGPQSQVHGVGDGAPWIVDQFTETFGAQGSYLLDFYHVSQYLAAAAQALKSPGKDQAWRRRQQGRLLNNQSDKVLRSLAPHREPADQEEAPVRAAHDYLHQRRRHLDYAGARARQLPIGSGEIESGHRHVIQQRLKRSGTWWKETNAEAMLNLRVARANNLWLSYWQTTQN